MVILEDKVGVEPEGGKLEAQGFGWLNSHGTGKGGDTTTAGFEGAWTVNPTQWDSGYFDVLLGYDWEQTTSASGHVQWTPTAASNADQPPAAHDASRTEPLMMTTADMALKLDPGFAKISKNFHENPDEFADAYARAWFKLTHRDMGPIACYLGEEVPSEELIWQDPIPAHTGAHLTDAQIASLKKEILGAGLSTIRLAPQKDWDINTSSGVSDVISVLEGIQSGFDGNVSVADLIVLGGCAAIEQASDMSVPFTPGRTDATQAQTDVDSFAVLEPHFDGFRNYKNTQDPRPTEALLVDRAQLLNLTAPEMTVLVGGLRSLGANAAGSSHGVMTDNAATLSNEVFVNLLDMSTEWTAIDSSEEVFEGRDRKNGKVKYTATRADLVFGSNSILRGLAEVYAETGAEAKFKADFIAAWNKVMMLDRFDITYNRTA